MMPGLELLAAFALSLVGCGLYRALAGRWGIVDVPNRRSSHAVATPKGGGVALLLGLGLGLGLSWGLDGWLAAGWPGRDDIGGESLAGEGPAGGGLAGGSLAGGIVTGGSLAGYGALLLLAGLLALVGLADDRRGLPASLRFGVYFAVCLAAVWLLRWPAPPSSLGTLLEVSLLAALAVGALWFINLFNFMDGIDGLAATEALFASSAAAVLALLGGSGGPFVLFCLLLAAACLGFLFWNWSPARLFLGDAGSIPLGFLLAALALTGGLPLPCWLILLAVFVGDATITLAWRVGTGQRFTQAHRLHAYQRLARHWGSHARVVWAVVAYNLLWLAPLAALAHHASNHAQGWAPLLLAAAYLPVWWCWRWTLRHTADN